jgi:hypothetical protein
MKNYYLIPVFLGFTAAIYAQNVGINTTGATPNPTSGLDIDFTDKGLLIPRVSLTSLTTYNPPITGGSPTTSMLVYNTNNTIGEGYYYWDGSMWVKIITNGSNSSDAWLATGNAGTTPVNNFIGTTDNQALAFRVNNQETFRFNAPGVEGPAWSIQRGGGNTRGMHAVDLQSFRSQTTQVASGDFSVICGGRFNTASGQHSFVGGGSVNTASGQFSFVGGGSLNTTSEHYSFVGGGYGNAASGHSCFVGSGQENSASGMRSFAGGGYQNNASGNGSFVGGGNQNTASEWYSFAGGGYQNTASGHSSFVGGGSYNIASNSASFVGGGNHNTASGFRSFVGGGNQNTASGVSSAIPGGYNLRIGARSFGFSGQTSLTQTDLSAWNNIAAFVDVDMWLYNVRNQASQLRLFEPSGSGTNYTALQAQAQTSDITYTLPASLTPTPTVESALLQTDASGNLSWVSPMVLGVNNAWNRTGNSGTNPAINFLGTTDAQPLVMRTNNIERMRITPAGNVGIGTATPNSRLNVFGGNGTYITVSGNMPAGDGTQGLIGYTWENAAGGGYWRTYLADPDGGFGVTPRSWEVWEYPANQGTGTCCRPRFRILSSNGLPDPSEVVINSQGRVGIGTINPGGLLELSLDQGRKPGTNTWTVVSDERLKDIHGPYSKGLNEILKLNPVTYNYKNVGERTFAPEVLKTTAVGFSAQEVQKVFPEAVGVDDDGYLNFNMHAILVAYVNAIKEQQAIIEAQKMEIELLKQKSVELDNLKAEVDLIKSQLINSNLQGLKR